MNTFLMQAALGTLSGVANAAQAKIAEALARKPSDVTRRSPGSKHDRPPPDRQRK